MFRLSSLQPAKLAGTLQLPSPVRGLGVVTDVDGRRWDIHAIIGDTVCAVPADQLHPYFADTSGRQDFGVVSQRWEPYAVNIVRGSKGEKGS